MFEFRAFTSEMGKPEFFIFFYALHMDFIQYQFI